MERAHRDRIRVRGPNERCHALAQLACRLVGEGHRQQPARRDGHLSYKMRDARGQDTRFARARPGRDAHGTVGTHHRRELLLIHAAKQRERGDGDLIYG